MDEQSFEELAIAEWGQVSDLARSLTYDHAEADDLVQETFLRAWRWRHSFTLRDHGIRPWLLMIARRTFCTWRSERKRHPAPLAMADTDVACCDAAVSETMDWDRCDERLKRAFDRLPAVYREVLVLWAVDERTCVEIAAATHASIGTVTSRLMRAKRALLESLQGTEPK